MNCCTICGFGLDPLTSIVFLKLSSSYPVQTKQKSVVIFVIFLTLDMFFFNSVKMIFFCGTQINLTMTVKMCHLSCRFLLMSILHFEYVKVHEIDFAINCRKNTIIFWLKRSTRFSESLKRRGWNGCKSRTWRTVLVKVAHGNNKVLLARAPITVHSASAIFRTDFDNPVSVILLFCSCVFL